MKEDNCLKEEKLDKKTFGSIEQLIQEFIVVKGNISKVIFGQSNVVDEMLAGILSGGHILLVGVPGLGKTKLVEITGKIIGLDCRRIQCTPDLMPADILGSEILDEGVSGQRSFRFVKGPIFAQLLMADEINRASPRTQSALLQAMQESRISVAGEYHSLPSPFHVMATQNPIEHEGTYPLPEAQLDRFFMQINVGYPDLLAEKDIVINTTGLNEVAPKKVMTSNLLKKYQKLVRQVPVGTSVLDSILKLIRLGRPESSDIGDVISHVAWGPGPRASQAMMLAVRARALLNGRLAPSVDDVIKLAGPILRHRIGLTFTARAEGIDTNAIINKLCERIA